MVLEVINLIWPNSWLICLLLTLLEMNGARWEILVVSNLVVTMNYNTIFTSHKEHKQNVLSLLQAGGTLLKWTAVQYSLNSTEKLEFFFSDKDQN